MVLATFSSRSSMSPQVVQTWVRTDRRFHIRSPQPEQSCLRRVRRIHRCHSLAGACCLAREDRAEGAPPGVLNALVEARFAAGSIVCIPAGAVWLRLRTAAHIGRLNGLDIDHVVRAYERKGGLVMEVAPLP